MARFKPLRVEVSILDMDIDPMDENDPGLIVRRIIDTILGKSRCYRVDFVKSIFPISKSYILVFIEEAGESTHSISQYVHDKFFEITGIDIQVEIIRIFGEKDD